MGVRRRRMRAKRIQTIFNFNKKIKTQKVLSVLEETSQSGYDHLKEKTLTHQYMFVPR